MSNKKRRILKVSESEWEDLNSKIILLTAECCEVAYLNTICKADYSIIGKYAKELFLENSSPIERAYELFSRLIYISEEIRDALLNYISYARANNITSRDEDFENVKVCMALYRILIDEIVCLHGITGLYPDNSPKNNTLFKLAVKVFKIYNKMERILKKYDAE